MGIPTLSSLYIYKIKTTKIQSLTHSFKQTTREPKGPKPINPNIPNPHNSITKHTHFEPGKKLIYLFQNLKSHKAKFPDSHNTINKINQHFETKEPQI